MTWEVLSQIYYPSQRKSSGADILEKMARRLDGRMVLCEK
jgi:hypothetical protein